MVFLLKNNTRKVQEIKEKLRSDEEKRFLQNYKNYLERTMKRFKCKEERKKMQSELSSKIHEKVEEKRSKHLESLVREQEKGFEKLEETRKSVETKTCRNKRFYSVFLL